MHAGTLLLVAALTAGPVDGRTSSTSGRTLVPPYESSTDLTPASHIDELVFAKLREKGVEPANVCSDAVFLRRVYLDVIGTLPTLEEARRFLWSREPDKRQQLVEQLLQREEFADYWAMKWSDLLRVKSEFPINLWPNAVQAYHRWIRDAVRNNMPYDRFVRELLTASGSNFRKPQVNFYRAVQRRDPKSLASAVALTFMGVRTDTWPAERLDQMAVFFSRVSYKSTKEWKEEIVYFDPFRQEGPSAPKTAVFPDGTRVRLAPDQDPRVVFADWLIRPENPWFTKNIVNRLWYWLLGRGVIHPPDDIRPDNPPSNPELLEYLQQELVAAHYDLKHLFRLILNSKTYQLSCIPRSHSPDAAKYFAYYPLRRLDAEVLIDAICQVTGTHEEYSSRTPEPYTFIPENQRTIELADGSMTSSFLELFGRPPRDTGLESERKNRVTAAQRLHLLNSSHIQKKIANSPKLRQLARQARRPVVLVSQLYLTILSRYPTAEELQTVADYARRTHTYGMNLVTDVAWALINSPEFLYRH